MTARIDRVVTAGTFSLDGGTWEVENNVWIVGDDAECVVIDAAHDAAAISGGIGDRRLLAILCTHAHDDHIGAAGELAESHDAPVWLHPADRELWDRVYPDRAPDGELADGHAFTVGGVVLTATATPGHTWGGVSFLCPALDCVFTGDVLFPGGPGATGRSFSDFPTIIESITTKLLTLPETTVVHAGHGDDTSIGVEAPHLQEWIERGH